MFTRAGSRSAREHKFEEVNGRISVLWLSVRPSGGRSHDAGAWKNSKLNPKGKKVEKGKQKALETLRVRE